MEAIAGETRIQTSPPPGPPETPAQRPTHHHNRIESAREKLLNQICRDRKWSVSFLLTLLGLSLVTFLCEREILRTAWASGSTGAGSVDAYGDKIKIKTSDAGIFVGIRKTLQVPLILDENKSAKERNEIVEEEISNNLNFLVSGESRDRTVDSLGVSSDTETDSGSRFVSMATTAAPTTASTTPGPTVKTTMEKTYYVFRGIPYAQPPEGPLRWKDPQVVDIKSSAQDNTRYKSVCSQWSRERKRVIGSEDCLYLNIFTPHIPPTLRRPFLPNPYTVQDIFYQQRHLYPVLIHVHGGDLLTGSGNDYSAQKLLATQDVVLVTFNYRLGIFGFFSTGDRRIPGNYGLLDQIAAIKWVQKYVQRFGGNPTRVTIFGDVGHLLLSPLAVGLFQGAIWMGTDSTSLFSPPGNRSLIQNPREFYAEMTRDAGCNDLEGLNDPDLDLGGDSDLEDLAQKRAELTLDCLKLLPTAQLVQAQNRKLKFHTFPRRFVPVKDVGWRDFPVMMAEPEVLMEMGTLVKAPIIAGVSAIEGYSMLLDFTEKLGSTEDLRSAEKVRGALWENLKFVFEGEAEAVYDAMFEAIWTFYFGEPMDPGYGKGLSKKLLSLFGDLNSHAGFWKLCKKLTRNSKPPAFAYVFNHQTTEFQEFFYHQRQILFANSKNGNSTGQEASSESKKIKSIPPWEDLHYILSTVENSPSSTLYSTSGGSRGQSNEVTLEDNSSSVNAAGHLGDRDPMEEIMVKIWTSFANYGTPKQAISEFENWTRWHRIEPSKVRYYDLALQPGSMKTSFRNQEALFWYETLQEVREEAVKNEELKAESASFLLWTLLCLLILLALLISSALLFYFCCSR